MKKFNKFIFEKYSFDKEKLKASFFYSFDNGLEIFEEIIDFHSDKFKIPENSPFLRGSAGNIVKGEGLCPILDNFLFNLHISLGISYYKLYPTKILEIRSGFLDEKQIEFWEKFYRNGLGEFFIKNNIDFSELINFNNSGNVTGLEELNIKNNYIKNSDNFLEGKNLLLWGGGKDSITSYSILREQKKDFNLFVFGKIDKIKKNTSDIAEKEILLVKRQLSNNLFKLNQEGYYNGHVPITGIIAFITFVVSYLYGYSNIILSNEKSASENNTTWKGLKINHQYSKSFEFEQDLNNYLHNYISRGINYFSLLRGMYEYKIAQIFSKEKKFFKNFSSCNKNFVITKEKQKKLWCCECEKCCFVFLILSPFLEENELISIFGENLFNNTSLEKTFRELMGFENYKPFECVGTYEEVLLSAKKSISKNMNGILLKKIKKEVFEKCDDKIEKELEKKLLKIDLENSIPEKISKLLK